MEQTSDGTLKSIVGPQSDVPRIPTISSTRGKGTKITKCRKTRTKELRTSQEQLVQSREKLVGKRAELQLHSEDLSDVLDGVREAHHAFMDEAQLSSNHPLHVLSARFANISIGLHNQVEEAGKLKSELEQLEKESERKDAAFVVDAEDAVASLTTSQKREKTTIKAAKQAPNQLSRNQTPSPRSQYFSRAGDVKVYIERLRDLDIYHMEMMTERDMILDRGDQLDSSDEQAQHEYELKRQSLLSKLAQAEHERDSLKAICDQFNIDIDPRQGARSESSATSADFKDAVGEPALEVVPERILRSHGSEAEMEGLASQDESHRNTGDEGKIWGWIQDVGIHEDAGPHIMPEECVSEELPPTG